MHRHTSWKIFTGARSYLDIDSHIYVTQATNIVSERSTNETPRNILHRMDRSHDTMQLNMIVTLDAEIVIITSLSVGLNQYFVPKI